MFGAWMILGQLAAIHRIYLACISFLSVCGKLSLPCCSLPRRRTGPPSLQFSCLLLDRLVQFVTPFPSSHVKSGAWTDTVLFEWSKSSPSLTYMLIEYLLRSLGWD